MKYILILAAVLFLSFTMISDSPVDRLGVKGPLQFNKSKYELVWSDKPNDKYLIQEYLPKGEMVDRFNQMLTLHLFITPMSIQEAVQQKVTELEQRKKTDPVCNYVVNESPDGKEFMIDCMFGESKADKMTVVEFNVYRFKQIDLGSDKKGIIIYAYSKRSYGDDIAKFLKSLKNTRTEYLNAMIAADIPLITIQ